MVLVASLGMSLLYIGIWTTVMVGTIIFILKIRNPHNKKRKPDKAYQEKLSRALAENWIRVNIKNTKYSFGGITSTNQFEDYVFSETSMTGGLERQFSKPRIISTINYDYVIKCEFELNSVRVESISHLLHMNPTSVQMFCESGLFDILVNPNNHHETVWHELNA